MSCCSESPPLHPPSDPSHTYQIFQSAFQLLWELFFFHRITLMCILSSFFCLIFVFHLFFLDAHTCLSIHLCLVLLCHGCHDILLLQQRQYNGDLNLPPSRAANRATVLWIDSKQAGQPWWEFLTVGGTLQPPLPFVAFTVCVNGAGRKRTAMLQFCHGYLTCFLCLCMHECASMHGKCVSFAVHKERAKA